MEKGLHRYLSDSVRLLIVGILDKSVGDNSIGPNSLAKNSDQISKAAHYR